MTPPPRGSPYETEASLGKRKNSDNQDAWYPGMDHGPQNEQVKRSKHFNTTMLFLELQAQVKSAIDNKRKHDEKERQISLQIAKEYPIPFKPSPDFKLSLEEAVKAQEPAARKPEMIGDMEYICKKKGHVEPEFPAPLSAEILAIVRKELHAGAVFSIDTCLKCWREKKMDLEEVLFTIRSFAKNSPALLASLEEKVSVPVSQCEVASAEQMRELSMLACA